MANSVSLDYERLFGASFASAKINIGGIPNLVDGSNTIIGMMTSELAFGAGNNWNTPLESQQQDNLSNQLQAGGTILTGAANKLGFNFKNPSYTLRTLEQSIKLWTGSSLPIFSVKMIFVAVREDQDVTGLAASLFAAAAPLKNIQAGASFIKPPLGYAVSGINAQSGTFSVELGNNGQGAWFSASNQVMTDVNFTFSKETIANGNPLYAEGTISFTPFRIVTADVLQSYLGWY